MGGIASKLLAHGIGVGSNGVDKFVRNLPVASGETINAYDMCSLINGQVKKSDAKNVIHLWGLSLPSVNYTASVIDSTHILLTYISLTGNQLYCVVGTVDGNGGITWGAVSSAFSMTNSYSTALSVAVLSNSLAVVQYAYQYGQNGNGDPMYTIYWVPVNISGTTISSFGTIYSGASGSANWNFSITKLNSTQLIYSYYVYGGNGTNTFLVYNYSGGTFTACTNSGIVGTVAFTITVLDSTHLLLSGSNPNSPFTPYVQVAVVTGTTVTGGTYISGTAISVIGAIDSSTFLYYAMSGSVAYFYVGKVSGTTVTLNQGNTVSISDWNSIAYAQGSVIGLSNGNKIVCYKDNSGKTYQALFSVISNVITLISILPFNPIIDSNYYGRLILSDTQIMLFGTRGNCYQVFSIDSNGVIADYTMEQYGMAVALAGGTGGNSVSCQIRGVVNGYSSLKVGQTYFIDINGTLSTQNDNLGQVVGVAISSTEMYLI